MGNSFPLLHFSFAFYFSLVLFDSILFFCFFFSLFCFVVWLLSIWASIFAAGVMDWIHRPRYGWKWWEWALIDLFGVARRIDGRQRRRPPGGSSVVRRRVPVAPVASSHDDGYHKAAYDASSNGATNVMTSLVPCNPPIKRRPSSFNQLQFINGPIADIVSLFQWFITCLVELPSNQTPIEKVAPRRGFHQTRAPHQIPTKTARSKELVKQ